MTEIAPFRTDSVICVLQKRLPRFNIIFRKSHCMENLGDCPIRPARVDAGPKMIK